MRFCTVFLLALIPACIPVEEGQRVAGRVIPLVKETTAAGHDAKDVPTTTNAPAAVSLALAEAGESENVAASLPEDNHEFDGLLCGKERHDGLMKFWPKAKGLDYLRREGLILFDEKSMPRLYQVTDEGRWSVLSPDGQTSVNNEDPWNVPGGIAPGTVKKFGFLQVTAENPILWWHGRKSDGTFNGIDWRFQEGTRVGEVMIVTDAEGWEYTVLVRTKRKRSIDFNDWTDQEYRVVIGEDGDSSPAALVGAEFEPMKGNDRLDTIVPRGFTNMTVDNKTCQRCHADTGKMVRERRDERRWRVRGSDGVFTIHVFSADDPTKLNPKLVEAGLLVKSEKLP
jgi:hypothetical protein